MNEYVQTSHSLVSLFSLRHIQESHLIPDIPPLMRALLKVGRRYNPTRIQSLGKFVQISADRFPPDCSFTLSMMRLLQHAVKVHWSASVGMGTIPHRKPHHLRKTSQQIFPSAGLCEPTGSHSVLQLRLMLLNSFLILCFVKLEISFWS